MSYSKDIGNPKSIELFVFNNMPEQRSVQRGKKDEGWINNFSIQNILPVCASLGALSGLTNIVSHDSGQHHCCCFFLLPRLHSELAFGL